MPAIFGSINLDGGTRIRGLPAASAGDEPLRKAEAIGWSIWRDGTGVPSNSSGSDGDYYLDDSTGNVYRRSGGVYSIVSNIKGAAGATGTAGVAGATGPTGATGATGAAGTAGITPIGATWVIGAGIITIPVNLVPAYADITCAITGVTILTEGGTGSCVIDIFKSAIGAPTSANSICGSSKPTISAGKTYSDTTLTGWTTAIAAGDTLRFSLVSSSTFTLVAVRLKLS